METNREKAVPAIIAECLKAGAQVAERIAEIEASLSDGLAMDNPTKEAECNEEPDRNPACGYAEQLRELLATLQRADKKGKGILSRLEV